MNISRFETIKTTKTITTTTLLKHKVNQNKCQYKNAQHSSFFIDSIQFLSQFWTQHKRLQNRNWKNTICGKYNLFYNWEKKLIYAISDSEKLSDLSFDTIIKIKTIFVTDQIMLWNSTHTKTFVIIINKS